MDELDLTIAQAAEKIGVTNSAVMQMIRGERIPAEKIGKRYYITPAIVDGVVELKEKFGKRWAIHAPWNGGDGLSVKKERKSRQRPKDPEPESLNVYQRLLKKAEDCAENRDFQMACQFYDTLCKSLDLSGME